jgi:hypothetical protein
LKNGHITHYLNSTKPNKTTIQTIMNSIYENNNIIIGYLPKHQAVRINHKNPIFDEEYMKMNEMLLGTESYYNEYLFLKTLRVKLEKGEVYIEQITSYISNSYKKLDGGEIMYLMDIQTT